VTPGSALKEVVFAMPIRAAIALTAKYCASAKYKGDPNKKKNKDIRWHTDPTGLGLRIYPTGIKSWVLQYRLPSGIKKLMTLAKYGEMTLEQAEKDAKVRLGRLHSSDQIDPLAARQAQKLDATTDTVDQLLEAWLAARNPKRAADVRSNAELYTHKAMGSRPWRTLTRAEVRAWHAKNGKRSKASANHALAHLRAAVYWRILQDDDTEGNAPERRKYQRDARNPCAGVQLFKIKERQVRIEPEDWPKFVAAIEFETSPKRFKGVVAGNGASFKTDFKTDPYMRAFFHFCIAMGCRKTEARTLEWSNVKLSHPARVTFRGVKAQNGEIIDRTVPLSDYAAKWLKDLEPQEGNSFVFCGFKKGQPIISVNKIWKRIRERAGFPHVWIHDLRRTFGSWLGDVGFSDKQVGTVLGHKSQITSKVYMALSDKPKQFAVDAVGSFLDSNKRKIKAKANKKKNATAINLDTHGNIIPFQKRRASRA
jgi:integrase